jgi:hypothetical protein
MDAERYFGFERLTRQPYSRLSSIWGAVQDFVVRLFRLLLHQVGWTV